LDDQLVAKLDDEAIALSLDDLASPAIVTLSLVAAFSATFQPFLIFSTDCTIAVLSPITPLLTFPASLGSILPLGVLDPSLIKLVLQPPHSLALGLKLFAHPTQLVQLSRAALDLQLLLDRGRIWINSRCCGSLFILPVLLSFASALFTLTPAFLTGSCGGLLCRWSLTCRGRASFPLGGRRPTILPGLLSRQTAALPFTTALFPRVCSRLVNGWRLLGCGQSLCGLTLWSTCILLLLPLPPLFPFTPALLAGSRCRLFRCRILIQRGCFGSRNFGRDCLASVSRSRSAAACLTLLSFLTTPLPLTSAFFPSTRGGWLRDRSFVCSWGRILRSSLSLALSGFCRPASRLFFRSAGSGSFFLSLSGGLFSSLLFCLFLGRTCCRRRCFLLGSPGRLSFFLRGLLCCSLLFSRSGSFFFR